MRQRPVIEALEPRILYSADAGLALGLGLNSGLNPPDAAHEVVVIDSRVSDVALLVRDLAQQGRSVITLDDGHDALEQISAALAGRENVTALHIISHGTDGVTLEALQRNPSLAEGWKHALTADADILLYGCDVAASAEGRLLADTLARLTGADVSASDDATGHASLGGDWQLEYATGAIEAQIAPSAQAQAAWMSLLDSVHASYEPAFADLADHAYEVMPGQSWGQSFSYNSGALLYTAQRIDLVLYKDSNSNTGPDIRVSLHDALTALEVASGTISRASLGLTEGWVSIALNAAPLLTDLQAYYIQVETTGAGGVFVGVDESGTYADGDLRNPDGSAEAGKDMAFRLVNTASNAAPVLSGANDLAAIDEDPQSNAGTLVSALIAGQASDADAGALRGIAVTNVVHGSGAWQFSTDGGASWRPFANPTDSTARLLAADANTFVRFSPSTDFNGTVASALTFRAWDQSSGTAGYTADTTTNGGSSAFSTATATAGITVNAVNDAPTAAIVPISYGVAEDDTPRALGGVSIGDVDSGTGPVSVTVAVANGNLTLGSTTGLTFTAGANGSASMTFSATVGDANSALATLAYQPGANFNGTDSVSLSVDDLGNSGSGAAGTAGDTADITVSAVNDDPVLNAAQLTVAEGGTRVFAAGDFSITDPDNAAFAYTVSGIAGGRFEVFDGAAWSAAASFTSAQLAAGEVRFVHDGAETAPSFSVTASDGAAGSNTLAAAVTYAPVNDAPLAAASGASAAFIAGSGAVPLDAGFAVADVDSTTLASATITISGGFLAAEDGLYFTSNPATMGNIVGSYDGANGILTLSSAGASATLAQWQAALGSVTYANASAVPGNATRTVSIAVSDGAALSATVSVAVSVAPAPSSATTPAPTPIANPPALVTTPPAAVGIASPGAVQQPQLPQARAAAPEAPLLEASAELQLPPAATSSGSHAQSASAGGSGVPGFRPGASAGAGAGTAAEAELLAEAALQPQARALDLLQLGEPGRSGGVNSPGGGLAQLSENARREEEIQQHATVVLAAGSLTMTLAYLLWLVRGGALAASVLAALPAWRLVDPLPVLARATDAEADESDDDEAIAAFSEAPAEGGRA
jgi:hypothetical protein